MKNVLGLLAVCGAASVANAAITFEDYAPATDITNQYAAQGVLFGTLNTAGPASVADYVSYYGTNALCNAPGGGTGSRSLTLAMDFTTDISDLTLDFHPSGSNTGTFAVRFYNDNALTASDSLVYSGDSWITGLTWNLGSVDHVEIDAIGSGWLFAVDNISFTQVPAPSACALFGIAAMAAGRRRR